MQVVHLLIAAAAVFLFARSAPFPRTVRVLFAFSYFPFYEYGVICRNYALGMLLLFAFCAVFPRRDRSLLGPAAVLVLLAQTHLLMFILAFILAFLLAAERWWKRRQARPRFLAVGAVFVLLGLALAAYQVVPVGESTFSRKLDFSYEPAQAGLIIRTMSKTFVAVPEPRLNFWGNSILNLLPGPVGLIGPLLAPLLFFFALLALFDRPFDAGALELLLPCPFGHDPPAWMLLSRFSGGPLAGRGFVPRAAAAGPTASGRGGRPPLRSRRPGDPPVRPDRRDGHGRLLRDPLSVLPSQAGGRFHQASGPLRLGSDRRHAPGPVRRFRLSRPPFLFSLYRKLGQLWVLYPWRACPHDHDPDRRRRRTPEPRDGQGVSARSELSLG